MGRVNARVLSGGRNWWKCESASGLSFALSRAASASARHELRATR